MELIVATHNKGKLAEFQRILAPLGIQVLSQSQAGADIEVEETGATFLENAKLKAMAIYRLTGKPTVADDSGLCVDALEGRPGVYSARYCGENTPYPEKLAHLLEELKGVRSEKRTARFICAICCVLAEDTILTCEEACEGKIGFQPAGERGFGYDPLFYIGDASFAQMDDEEKDRISHRGLALRRFASLLEEKLRNFAIQ